MKKTIFLPAVIFILFFGIASSFGQTAQEEARRHFDRGMAAVEMAKSPEDYAAAINEFEQAARLAPDWPDIYYNLGLVQEKVEKYGDAIMNLKQYIRLAPNANDAETIKTLINKLEYRFDRLNTDPALIKAALEGQKEMVEQLIARGADINAKKVIELPAAKGTDTNARKQIQLTPLLAAAIGGHKEIVELLLAKGADINAKNEGGATALLAAVSDGHKEVAELLIAKGSDVNTRDENQLTPLHVAAYRGLKEVVELLIAKGFCPRSFLSCFSELHHPLAKLPAKKQDGISTAAWPLWRWRNLRRNMLPQLRSSNRRYGSRRIGRISITTSDWYMRKQRDRNFLLHPAAVANPILS
ncbi:MAG: tetratricopeptide repeat protein [Candidatus Aminicenantes bacterium]|nr:tetratricopeptide repeat protein [Candidatus Aminicenantes bacterium]